MANLPIEKIEQNTLEKVFTNSSILLIPLTFPFISNDCKVQLFKSNDNHIFGTAINLKGKITLITKQKIINPLNPSQGETELIELLENTTNLSWDLAWNIANFTITIWPHLEAAGKNENYKSQHDKFVNKSVSETLKIVNDELNRFVYSKKGALNREHYTAARIEMSGRVLLDEDGNPVINPKDGEPYEHIKDVEGYQNAAKKLKYALQSKLASNSITKEERDELQKLLSKVCKVLDDSKRFTTSADRSKTPSKQEFNQLLQHTKLIESYKASNPTNPIPANSNIKNDIGGVATSIEYIKGLFDSEKALLENEHIFCFKNFLGDNLPFSNEELQQLLRELAIGIYTYNTVPFFSLHFKQGTADLFPVIHPAYANTLVGRVIGMLDYIMKGYLNGGVYQEDFIDEWHKNPNWNVKKKTSFEKLISFGEYCAEHLTGDDSGYQSVNDIANELESNIVLENLQKVTTILQEIGGKKEDPDEEILKNFEGFNNSFRIIAEHKNFYKEEEIFLVEGSFDVQYTILPPQNYKDALNRYERKHGKAPDGYLKLIETYDLMKEKIRSHMQKMPLCREYFKMLEVISFFSSYYSTLKKHDKIPSLAAINIQNSKGCPPLFPHLPVSVLKKEAINSNIYKAFKNLLSKQKDLFKKFIRNSVYKILNKNSLVSLSESQDLINLLKQELKIESFTYMSSLFKKYSISNKEFDVFFHQYAETVFKTLYLEIETVIKTINFNQDLLNDLENFISKIFDLYISLKPFKNEKISLKTVVYSVAENRLNSNPSTDKTFKAIVGGCGLRLTQQKIKSSSLLNKVILKNWKIFQKMKFETWEKIKINKFPAFAFKLAFQDVPDNFDNYNWLDSFLLYPKNSNIQDAHILNLWITTITNNNASQFNDLLLSKNFINLIDRNNKTLLHYAATAENPYYLETLLKKGMNDLAVDINGYAPIHYAAMTGCIPNVELLLKYNINSLNIKSFNGSTPLVIAIENSQYEIVALLLKLKPTLTTLSSGYTELHCAIHQCNEKIINLILSYKPIFINCLNVCSKEGGTPLMMACELGLLDIIKKLLSFGARTDVIRKDGNSAIEIAIRMDNLYVLEALLKTSSPSSLAIDIAAQQGNYELLQLLANHHNFKNFRNSCDDTALTIALRNCNRNGAEFLIEYIDNLDQININGETALKLAVKTNEWNIVGKLLARGVLYKTIDLVGRTYNPLLKIYFDNQVLTEQELNDCLMKAANLGNHEIITHLLEPKGINLDLEIDSKGWKLIHYLAKFDCIFLFKKLYFKSKEFLHPIKKDHNKTIAYIAAESGSIRILDFLLKVIKKNNISLKSHYKDKHLFLAALKSKNLDVINLFFSIFKEEELVNCALDNKNTYATHATAKIGFLNQMKLILKKNATLFIEDNNQNSPLTYAILVNDDNLVKFLLENELKPTFKDFYLVIKSNNFNIFNILNNSNLLETFLNELLFFSIIDNDLQAFLSLVGKGASINVLDKNGRNPFIVAAQFGRYNILKAMIKRFGINRDYYQNNNAFHISCINGHASCVSLLLKNGFEIENNKDNLEPSKLAQNHPQILGIIENKQHSTRLIEALINDDIEKLAEILQQFKEEELFYYKDYYGSPLHFIIKSFSKDGKIAKNIFFLINRFTHFSKKTDSDGNSLAHLLLARKIPVHSLENIDFDIQNNEGQTLLHLAILSSEIDIIKYIVMKITNVNKKDKKKLTALNYAIINYDEKKLEIINYLLESGAYVNNYDHKLCTPLMYACKKSSFLTKKLLDFGANPNLPVTHEKIYPLQIAIELNNSEIVLALLFKGANPSLIDGRGFNSLDCAVACKDVRLQKILFSFDPNLDINSNSGKELIHYAAENGYNDLITLLLNKGYSIETPIESNNVDNFLEGATPLHLATVHGQLDTVNLLLANQANINAKASQEKGLIFFAAVSLTPKIMLKKFMSDKNIDNLNESAFYAIKNDNIDAVKELYNFGIPINTYLLAKENGLHVASRFGALQTTSWLLKNEINVDDTNSEGKNAYELSAVNNSYEQFKVLLDSKFIDLNKQNNHGQTLAHLALSVGNFKHLLLLILYGIDLNIQDFRGLTLLHLATEKNYTEIVNLLLLCGANQYLFNLDNKRPIDLANETIKTLMLKFIAFDKENLSQNGIHRAIRNKDTKTISFLAKFEEINHTDSNGMTALHLAVILKDIDAVMRLLKENINVDHIDNYGKTALWYAFSENYNLEIIKMLLKGNSNPLVKDSSGVNIIEHIQQSNLKNKEIILTTLNKFNNNNNNNNNNK
ncbi:Phosphocholine transferase AnkX [Candidatus Rubidus massiliensis]|nr:Phosphocholine transferase AnkX [Candidatus Rubidus massiliensis]